MLGGQLSEKQPLPWAVLFCFAKPQYTSSNRFLFSKMLLPRTGTLLNSSCQVLFSQLGAGQILSRKHKHTQDLPPLSLLSFLQQKQSCLWRHLTPTASSNSVFLVRAAFEHDRYRNNCTTREIHSFQDPTHLKSNAKLLIFLWVS